MRRRSGMIAFILALPGIVSAQAQNFQSLAQTFIQIFNSVTGTLIVVAIVIYFWGAAQRLFKEGKGSKGEWGPYLIWGIVILFVMVSVVGIVNILETTVFGSTQL